MIFCNSPAQNFAEVADTFVTVCLQEIDAEIVRLNNKSATVQVSQVASIQIEVRNDEFKLKCEFLRFSVVSDLAR